MATVILVGCGGSCAAKPQAEQWQSVAGVGFSFQAPAGWKVERAKSRVSARSSPGLVQVSTFRLLKTYDDKLFGRVAPELRSRMQDIARQTGGKLNGSRPVVADGVRSHAYEVTAGEQVDEYTFVLTGKREFLLLCRRTSSDGVGICKQLVTSFVRR